MTIYLPSLFFLRLGKLFIKTSILRNIVGIIRTTNEYFEIVTYYLRKTSIKKNKESIGITMSSLNFILYITHYSTILDLLKNDRTGKMERI